MPNRKGSQECRVEDARDAEDVDIRDLDPDSERDWELASSSNGSPKHEARTLGEKLILPRTYHVSHTASFAMVVQQPTVCRCCAPSIRDAFNPNAG